jgi:hypothetical protein
MESTKYIGMDVHKEAILVTAMNSAGKVVMEPILEGLVAIGRDKMLFSMVERTGNIWMAEWKKR